MVYYDVQNSDKQAIKRDETILYHGKLQVTIILDRLIVNYFIYFFILETIN
jgi:hypothetical protein